MSLRRRLPSRRRSFDARVGLVVRRLRCWRSAAASRDRSRSSASSRLRAWLRVSWATAVTRAPARATIRRRWDSLSEGEPSASKMASTRDAVTLACWPPGPDERLVRSSISASGIAVRGSTRMGSSMAANLHWRA